MKKLAVDQSNYIPWKGYFDMIHDVDEFCFYDDVQYTTRDWRNRNKIMTANGAQWLSVPVGHVPRGTLICDVAIKDPSWQEKHLKTLRLAYCNHPFWDEYQGLIDDLYVKHTWTSLSELNHYSTRAIAEILGIETTFTDSRNYQTEGAKHERMLSLVKNAGAGLYLSGPAAKDYIIADDYASAGIKLAWKDYDGYPDYPQRGQEGCNHNVTILDLLFNVGDKAPWYIWGWREGGGHPSYELDPATPD